MLTPIRAKHDVNYNYVVFGVDFINAVKRFPAAHHPGQSGICSHFEMRI